MFMGATVFEIAGGGGGVGSTPLVKGVGTKRLGKGRVNILVFQGPLSENRKVEKLRKADKLKITNYRSQSIKQWKSKKQYNKKVWENDINYSVLITSPYYSRTPSTGGAEQTSCFVCISSCSRCSILYG